ncbi:MAG: methyltransferase [Propionicimonas sp.]|nr:methyltransferase [Propionicimonas sp.]
MADPVSRLLADELQQLTGRSAVAGPLLVIDDPALANHLRQEGRDVLASCDDLRDERSLTLAGVDCLDQSTLAAAQVVLLRLPKSLGMLQDYAERIAAWAPPDVRVLAGGREKHLTRSMNDVLAGCFGSVRASLGRQKSRVLHAEEPLAVERSWPRRTELDEPALTVVSHAGVFAAGRLDGGTRLLLEALEAGLEPAERHLSLPTLPAAPGRESNPDSTQPSRSNRSQLRAVDLGCGSGILACTLARAGHTVLAVDVSRAAVASTRDTAAANQLAIEVERADGLAGHPAGSVDLVVCNPPFHRGTTKDSSPGFDLLATAIPTLAPGAEVWTVFNSHLPYLPFLRRQLGATGVVVRDRHYTVTRSVLAR